MKVQLMVSMYYIFKLKLLKFKIVHIFNEKIIWKIRKNNIIVKSIHPVQH